MNVYNKLSRGANHKIINYFIIQAFFFDFLERPMIVIRLVGAPPAPEIFILLLEPPLLIKTRDYLYMF